MGLMRFLLLSVLLTSLASADRVVLTESGPVRGKTVASGRVEAYLGIPYAEPPVGQLRFAKPVPKRSWTDVFEAIEKPPPCIQQETKIHFLIPDLSRMSEDCLYLNVWVPKSSKADEGKPKTVMFYIHGGGFYFGSSDMKVYDGARLSEHGDVVVVTINYRLGALGFFYGNTEDAPGNLAIRDQILALRWVKENARHFNGDPDSITIFGQSAGAFSVSLLQLSPSSRDLYKRAILQSGSAVNPKFSVGLPEAAEINLAYAQELGCASKRDHPEDLLKCMREVPAEAFPKAQEAASKNGVFTNLPKFGEELFPKGAVSLFKEGQFKDSEVLMGVTRDEGMWSVINFLTGPESDVSPEDIFNRTSAYEAIKRLSPTRTLLEMTTPEEAERIVLSYLDDVEKDSSKRTTYVKVFADALGDAVITCGAVFQAEYQSARGDPVYVYMFDHHTANSPYPKWTGVPHAEEVPYVFGNPIFGDFTEEEKELSMGIMHMWTAFAKTGNPPIPGGPQWPRYTPEDPKYYVIGLKDRVDTRPDNHRCERWRSIFLGTDR